MSDSYFGCFTGDCPHQKQSECDAAIKEHCAELEQENDLLRKQAAANAIEDDENTVLIASLKEQLATAENAGKEAGLEWISVDERLPEFSGRYLTIVAQGLVGEVCGTTIEYFENSPLISVRWHVNPHQKVTHWMPLPEPPRSEIK